MTKLILAVVFLLALGIVGTVQADIITLTPNADTFINYGTNLGSSYALGTNCGTIPVTLGGNYGNCGIMLTKADSLNNRLATYLLFNISTLTNRIITSANLSVGTNTVPAGTCNYTIYTNSNVTWNETNLSGTYPTNNSIFESTTRLNISLKASISTSENFIGNPTKQALIKNIYFNTNNLLTLVIDDIPIQTCITGDTMIYSKEEGSGAYPPTLNFTVADYHTQLVQGTDITTLYYDFDTKTGSVSPMPFYDFSYDSTTGVLTPHNANQVFIGTEMNQNNTLDVVNCANEQGFYSSSAISQLNNPMGSYDLYCFDLSSSHAGKAFYGAIKLINNTNVRGGATPEFDFFASMYSPLFTQFTNFLVTPSPASAGRNLTFAWATTTPLTTILRYQIFDPFTNTTSAVNTIFGNQNLSTNHLVSIDASELYRGGLTLTYFVVGQNAFNNTYASSSFSVLLSDFQEQLVERTSGINFLITDEFNLPLRAFVSLDRISPISTSYVATNNTAGYAFVASFFGFGLGQHNVSVTADGYSAKNFSINVVAEPFFLTVKMSPFQSCKFITEVNTVDGSNGCESAVRNSLHLYPQLNITSWYCIFDQAGCLTFDVNHTALCGGSSNYPSGTWKGWACLDGYVPSGAPVNASIPIGSGLNGTGQGNRGIGGAGTGLGLTQEQTLNLFAMIIILIIVGAVGIVTKDVGVTGIIFIGMTGAFTLINWLPWWFLLIEVVLVIFLIARFFRQTMTPQ